MRNGLALLTRGSPGSCGRRPTDERGKSALVNGERRGQDVYVGPSHKFRMWICTRRGAQSSSRMDDAVPTAANADPAVPRGSRQPASSAEYSRAIDVLFTQLTREPPLWQPTAPPPLPLVRDIFWLHFPKAASSFSTTITLHEASPSPADRRRHAYSHAHYLNQSARARSQADRKPFAGLVNARFPLQTFYRLPGFAPPEGFHVPLQWSAKQPHAGTGSVVAIFRDPLQRLLSARAYMQRHRGCCGLDWGLSRVQGERARAAPTALEFARLPGMRGCMAKMLLGHRCCDVVGKTIAPRLPRAVRFVEERMAFVGLVEEWERTVCLWHVRFGGPVFAAELLDSRPTSSCHAGHTRYNDSLLDGMRDEADAAVYAAAKRRFDRELHAHRAAVDACLRSVAAHRPAETAGERKASSCDRDRPAAGRSSKEPRQRWWINRWARRRVVDAEHARQRADEAAAIRQRRLQLCNGTSRVLISIAIGTETSACSWVDALIENALAFTRADTVVAIHLSSALACPPGDLERWRGTLARGSRGLVNPVRIATQLGHGSVLYGHLLNARAAAARWEGCCCSFVMQASNMLWVRRGMEDRVEQLGCSVGREGWRRPDEALPLLMSGWRKGAAGDEISSRFYLNLTRTRHPMSARDIFALRASQPERRAAAAAPAAAAASGRHAWSYHEGSFYPHATVLRFLRHLEGALSLEQILRASNSPEEFWLPAWTLNHEPPAVPVQSSTQQLALRVNISYHASTVPLKFVQKARDDLACPQDAPFRFYALKRFSRNASDAVAAGILQLSSRAAAAAASERRPPAAQAQAPTRGSSGPGSGACARARAARGRFP